MFKALFSASHLGIRTAAQFAVVLTAGSVGMSVAATSASAELDAIANNAGSPTNISSGTLSLVASAISPSTGFTQTITAVAPGDTRNFYVNLTNGTLPALNLTVSVADNGDTLLTRHTTPSKGLQVTIKRCSTAWVTGVCNDTETFVLAATAIKTLNTSSTGGITATTVTSIAANEVLRLKFIITLPDQSETTTNGVLPATPIQGLSTGITWTFREVQRTGTNTDSQENAQTFVGMYLTHHNYGAW